MSGSHEWKDPHNCPVLHIQFGRHVIWNPFLCSNSVWIGQVISERTDMDVVRNSCFPTKFTTWMWMSRVACWRWLLLGHTTTMDWYCIRGRPIFVGCTRCVVSGTKSRDSGGCWWGRIHFQWPFGLLIGHIKLKREGLNWQGMPYCDHRSP